ncbi:MAG: hypothetical protein ACKO96_34950, partial [Flammeovirgaceae bacterium]
IFVAFPSIICYLLTKVLFHSNYNLQTALQHFSFLKVICFDLHRPPRLMKKFATDSLLSLEHLQV